MTLRSRIREVLHETGTLFLGWFLVIAGIPLLPLPGPGTIVIVAGVALLARHYAWANNLLAPLQRQAVEAARLGVATWPRIVGSALGGVWLFVAGVIWWINPQVPEFEVVGIHFGPRLPFAGWGAGVGLITSALVGWGLLAYSVKRWRCGPDADVWAIIDEPR